MPKQIYALDKIGQQKIEITWKGIWKEITVSQDGQVLGVIPNQKALLKGAEFRLLDGSTLKVHLFRTLYFAEFRVLRNGQPLQGSASHPLSRVRTAYWMVYFVAGVNLLLGVLSLAGVQFAQQVSFGVISLIAGVIFLALGFFAQRMSSVALILAVTLMALDGFIAFIIVILSGNPAIMGGLIARIGLIIPMIQGISAIKQVKLSQRISGQRAVGSL